jgi:hypothetical protein
MRDRQRGEEDRARGPRTHDNAAHKLVAVSGGMTPRRARKKSC